MPSEKEIDAATDAMVVLLSTAESLELRDLAKAALDGAEAARFQAYVDQEAPNE